MATDFRSGGCSISTPSLTFYNTGGTLPANATSYLERQADKDLLSALLAGEYCYVLNSRQMGKSSLSVRTMAALNEAGVKTVFLDLTRFGGATVTPEQWYLGMLAEVGRSLNLRKELLEYWRGHQEEALVPRFFGAVHEAVLSAPAPLVLFIDEIDAVKSLSFSSDEFFAALRECYNRRVQDETLRRFSVCLVGSATPSDLIADTRTSPFNIGKRVELRDFTLEECLPLARGLNRQNAADLIRRAHYWTNGHPYLTQSLCAAIAQDNSAVSTGDVDALASALFFEARAREQNPNLADVSNRLLSSYLNPEDRDEHRSSILDLYGRILKGRQRIADDETNRLIALLKLAGIVRGEGGRIHVRNRIYEHVFDRAWIEWNMPDAELRRQRLAYRRGLARALTVSGVVLLLVAGLAVFGLYQSSRAEKSASDAVTQKNAAVAAGKRADLKAKEALKALAEARRQKKLADDNLALAGKRLGEANLARAAESRAKLDAQGNAARAAKSAANARKQAEAADLATYIATMNLVQSEWENNNVGHVLELLEQTRSSKHRGFEWGYWNRLCHQERRTLRGHTCMVTGVAFSPDGKLFATTGGNYPNILGRGKDDTAVIWDAVTGKRLQTLTGHTGSVLAVSFSPDSRRVATVSLDQTARIWNVATGKQVLRLSQRTGRMYAVSFSPDGDRVVTGSDLEPARIWDSSSGKELVQLAGHTAPVILASFSPDGTRVITGSVDGTVRYWDPASGNQTGAVKVPGSQISCIAVSPDGRRIATGSGPAIVGGKGDGIKIWDAKSGALVLKLPGSSAIIAAAYSPDGSRLLTGGSDRTARLLDASTGQELCEYKGHSDNVGSVAFSPDGNRIVTGSWDRTVKIWDTLPASISQPLPGLSGTITAISQDGACALLVDAQDVRIVNCDTGKVISKIAGNPDKIQAASFRADGRQVITCGGSGVVKVLDVQSGKEVLRLPRGRAEPTTARFLPGGKRLLTESLSVRKLWDAATRSEVSTWKKIDFGGVLDGGPSVSPDGTRFVSADSLGAIGIWEISTGKRICTLKGHTERVGNAVYSFDGRRIVTCSYDETARVWDAQTGAQLHVLRGHVGWVGCAAFSPDGRRIATGGFDRTVRLWDSASGKQLCILGRHTGIPAYVAFTPDGTRLLSATYGYELRRWHCDNRDLMAEQRDLDRRTHLAELNARREREEADSRERTHVKELMGRAGVTHKNVIFFIRTTNEPYGSALFDFAQSSHVRSILEKGFVPVFLTIRERRMGDEPMGIGLEYVNRFGVSSYPFIAITDARGRKLIDSQAPLSHQDDKNIGYPTTPAEITHFVTMIRKTSTGITGADLDTMTHYLQTHKVE